MEHDKHGDGDASRLSKEVVFILRLRARNSGWWGQVKRLDNDTLRYIAGQTELYALLDSEWQIAHASDGNSDGNSKADSKQEGRQEPW